MKTMIKISEACVRCGACIKDCVAENLVMDNGRIHIKRECMKCGHCVAICPANAVTISSYDMADVENVDVSKPVLTPDTLLYTIKARRSIRDFRPCRVEEDKLKQLIQVGRYTPTGKNAQDCCFVVVQDRLKEFKQLVWSIVEETAAQNREVPDEPILLPGYKQFVEMKARKEPVDYLFRNAPTVLYIAADFPANAILAAQNIELMAIAQGLGAMYNGYLNRTANAFPQVSQWLGIKKKRLHICMLIGYPNIHYLRTAPRKDAEVVWR